MLLQQTGLMSSNIELRSANDEDSFTAAVAAMLNDKWDDYYLVWYKLYFQTKYLNF